MNFKRHKKSLEDLEHWSTPPEHQAAFEKEGYPKRGSLKKHRGCKKAKADHDFQLTEVKSYNFIPNFDSVFETYRCKRCGKKKLETKKKSKSESA